MGIKASTANGGQQSPRTRTFSTSSSSEVVSGSTGAPYEISSASPDPDSSSAEENAAASASLALGRVYATSLPTHIWSLNGLRWRSCAARSSARVAGTARPVSPAADPATSHEGHSGRAASPSQAYRHRPTGDSIKCPVCSKFVMPDDIECHLVMCLTKPRLSYNEDCLADAKGECVICLEDLCPGDIIARLPCLCIYHKGCIDKWFEVNRSCPEHPGD